MRKVGCAVLTSLTAGLGLATCLIFAGLVSTPMAMAQDVTGKIEGQIVDKQKRMPLAGHPVVLEIHRDEEIEKRQAVTDETGFYTFDNLSTAFDIHYTVSTTYEGETYVERDLVLSEWVSALKVNIEIGGVTDDSSAVRIKQHTLVISPPPEGHASDGAVSVMEIMQIENTSDQPFQTRADSGAAGLHLNLPTGYEGLQLDQVFEQDLGTTTGQLVSAEPLAPGTHNVGYSYVMHISSGLNLDLARELTFDTDQLYVFVAQGMPLTPDSRILGAGREERIHNLVYTIYATDAAMPLSAGDTPDLRLKVAAVASQPPGRVGPMQRQPADAKMIALIAVAAALAGGFLVAAILKTRSSMAQPAEPRTSQTAPDASWLRKLDAADLDWTRVARLEMIGRLEALHEKREISDRVYKRLRKEQTDRLAAVLERLNQ